MTTSKTSEFSPYLVFWRVEQLSPNSADKVRIANQQKSVNTPT